MLAYRSFRLLPVIALLGCIAMAACAPQVDTLSDAASAPATTTMASLPAATTTTVPAVTSATQVPELEPGLTASLTASQPSTKKATMEVAKIGGMFDIGGLRLYMNCKGSGSPTIVYIHGSIEDVSYSGASGAQTIQSILSDRYRFCVYDRRNVGRSDEVPGYWTGKTAVADLHALLATAEVQPPYVLLGASFGGLIAHIYSATYPDDVVGMVLLDSSVPGELELERLLPEDMRFNHEEDRGSNENLDHFATYEEAYALAAPEIPVTYLLATPSEWPTIGVPAWDAAILDTIREYVDSFSPGRWVEVESPHFMEPNVPEIIAEEIEKLIKSISR